jgi:flagellin-like protein
MDPRKRSVGVSPIIATLLLIAITVSAGVIVYVFVSGIGNGLTQGGGQQTAQQIELTAYAFTPLTGSSLTCDGNSTVTAAPCLVVSIKNVGGSSITIDTVLFDAIPLTPAGSLATTPISLSTNQDASFLIVGSGTFTAGHGGYTGIPSGISGGSSHVLKFVTKSGGLFAYTITAGTSQ